MKRVIINLMLATVILVIGIFMVLESPRFSGITGLFGTGGGAKRSNQASSTLHPRLEAHQLPDLKAPGAIAFEWIPYYYRHPRPEETTRVIALLLSQENAGQILTDSLNHFFAAVLHGHGEELEKLKAATQSYSGKQLETVTAVIREAEDYKAVGKVSPSTLELMWAEYMATGQKEIIAGMIQALEPSNNDQQVVKAIQESFYRHIPLHLEAHKALEEALENAPGALRARLQEMQKVIEKNFAEPANMHLYRADNHIKQREYDSASNEFEKSLEYYPDYQNVFISLANMYEAQGKLQEAFVAMKKAAQIDPTDPTVCYGMGRHCFMQKRFDEAINWYSEALKYHPGNHLLVHAIARSYQSKGDTANAVKYFRQYLQYAPNGEHADLVKRYLASVNASVAESDSIFDAFKKKDYEALETKLSAILKEKKKDKDGHSLLGDAYSRFYNATDAEHSMETVLAQFEDWLKSKPSSHFANAAIGMFCMDYAYHARGTGWGNTVTEEGRRLYRERLLKARDYLEKAYMTDPTDPLVPSHLIGVATGLGMDSTEVEKQFRRAIEADKSEFAAYDAKLNYLKPKWHGSEKQMFSFARETARNAPSDSLAPLLLAKAHWEMSAITGNKDYFKKPEVWDEVKSVYTTICRRFPESSERHNWFARTAYLAGDFDTARQELAIIKDDWLEGVWPSYVDFTKAKEEVLRR